MRANTAARILTGLLGLALIGIGSAAYGQAPAVITVDGVEYTAGAPFQAEVDHFYTATPNPKSVFTARHVWDGKHGAELLPCPGGVHWVDNKNLLTISHCLPDTTTTTTVPETTTSTVPQDEPTTTTVPETTTTVPEATTTTSVPPETTSTTTAETTTTTQAATTTTTPDELPYTGPEDNLVALALIGLGLIIAGLALTWNRNGDE